MQSTFNEYSKKGRGKINDGTGLKSNFDINQIFPPPVSAFIYPLNYMRERYNTFDIMKYVETEVTLENKYLLLIYFDNIREQFRNEKLLMFNLLFFVFMRPKFNLENIEIM